MFQMITPFKDDYMEEMPYRFEEVFLLNKHWMFPLVVDAWTDGVEVAQPHANFVVGNLWKNDGVVKLVNT